MSEGPIRPIEGPVDFGRTAADYAKHRAGFPPALFERLAPLGVGRAGQRALDLGTGTGALARGLALRGARVVGLDPARSLLVEGRGLDRAAGAASAPMPPSARRLTLVPRSPAGSPIVARAEALPFAAASFDVVAAGQCWHWFDRPRAAAEVRRVLVPGGALVIAHYDWVPLPGNVVEATEALIRRHNPAWTGHDGTGLHPRWLADCAVAGLESIETFSTDAPASYSHAAWRGRIRASAGVAASLAPAAVEAFDRELAALLAARFPSDPLAVPHRLFAVVARAPREGLGSRHG